MATKPGTSDSGSISSGGRSALTFDEFVDAALGAAIRAAQKHGGGSGKPGQLPFPIWVGIIAGPIAQGKDFGGQQ
jgi:hypothetical protein